MATSEEANMTSGKETESAIVFENKRALENLKITVAEEINKNKQNFDELSDRLQSIEASISKISKSNDSEKTKNDSQKESNDESAVSINDRLQSIEAAISKISKSMEDPPKSKDVSEKDPTEESIVPSNNTNKVPSKTVKRFQLKHVFKDVANFRENKYNYSEWEEHYNVKWKMCVKRINGHLGFYVHCEPMAPADKWSIRTKLEHKIVGREQEVVIRTCEYCYQKRTGWGYPKFLEWGEMKRWYLVDGNLTMEAKVTIVETAGLEKPKIRKFDESQKDLSDVILVVRDTKFHVSKMFLASQSPVFKALLFGNFKESKQSEVKLSGIDPDGFHYFLEVLYGEFVINDSNVEDILGKKSQQMFVDCTSAA
ncbi:unnamed protein product [Caenorhabditis nigoni]